MPAATSAPNAMTRMISVSGIEKTPALLRSFAKAMLTALAALAPPNSPTKKPGWARCASATLLRIGSSLSIAFLLSPRISNSTSAACLPCAIWPALAGSSGERMFCTAATVREAGHDVLDGRVEGGGACSKRAALDQHALTRGHLEPGIEDPVHAARLAGARVGRIGLLRADLAAHREGDQHERKPAEGGGLPVSGAPAAHAGREVRAALRWAGLFRA